MKMARKPYGYTNGMDAHRSLFFFCLFTLKMMIKKNKCYYDVRLFFLLMSINLYECMYLCMK